ncbi:anti-FecI sigma factor, FecR [Arcticibacter svalbardensis MN12-7]|uniref:Anti-FecI sigma factor, FecR n=1 Tax=Arcticibacter svalbardensis MN12-7 TaxID=1150600 RepID=R9GPT8_9SPHI|nr:FecR family protein [Arcticibacter svalbardensis]EOR93857.1 anti-FecI sigma factor, FecR [Arcticibacter svalbardensis MN12-7]
MVNRTKGYLQYLIDKVEENTISAGEKKLLDDYMQYEYDQAEWDAAKMGSKEKVSASIYQQISTPTQHKKSVRQYYKYAIAASIALLVCLGIELKLQSSASKIYSLSTSSSLDSVVLNDGSTVYLAAHSILNYPAQFEGQTREVSLIKGNAFFKVTKDPAHPFIITSGNIKTKVLGTSFHISLEKDRSSVTVVTGLVHVSSKKQVVILKPNEEVVATKAGFKKLKVTDTYLYHWYEKDIELNNVSLDKVFTLLKFKYGIQFNPENKRILDTRLTLYIKGDLPLQKILSQINYITNLKFKTYENSVVVNE